MVYNAPVWTYVSEQSVTDSVLSSSIESTPGKMSCGCQLVLNYTTSEERGYTFEAGWFHIVPQFSRQISGERLYPLHTPSLTQGAPGTADISAHINLNLFDLLIKKSFAWGEWVVMTPAAGLVGGYMEGTSRARFLATSGAFSTSGVTDATLTTTTKFEGVGLKLGGNCSFKVGYGFSFLSEFYYNVLYGLARADFDYTQNQLYNSLYFGEEARYSQHHGRTFFDVLLGLVWGRAFADDHCFFDIHLGWRFQSFSGGWKNIASVFSDSLYEAPLYGQGLEVGGTFKF
jgi:hypothetical protein